MENKFKGTLLGLAVGDAIGGPLEFMSPSQIQIKHGTVNSMIGGGWLSLRPGQYTEDTWLTIGVAENLLENKQLDAIAFVKRYLTWYRTNPKDGGPITKAVLAYAQEGMAIEAAAKQVAEELTIQSHNNEPLVWCIPLALMYFQNTDQLMKETMKIAMLTHYDKKVASAAAVINILISRMLNGETDRKKIWQQTFQLLDDNEVGLYNVMPDVADKKKEELRGSPTIQDTLETSLWAWLKTKTFQEAITTVLNVGGDTDTIGAITGALCGAYYGEENIPIEWLRSLEDKNIIAGLARRFFKLAAK